MNPAPMDTLAVLASNKTNNLNPETLAITPPIEEHTDFSGEMKVCGQG
jgi:hypothetical protein